MGFLIGVITARGWLEKLDSNTNNCYTFVTTCSRPPFAATAGGKEMRPSGKLSEH